MQELAAFYGCSIPQSEIDEILDDLPIDLDSYYDRILNRIPSRRHQKLHAVLKWLLFSDRPIFVEEAVDASIIHSNREVSFDKNDRLDPNEIVANLMGLVKLQPSWSASAEPIPYKSHILTLSHFSVHEYLLPLKNPARPSTKRCRPRGILNPNWLIGISRPVALHTSITAVYKRMEGLQHIL
jgi:hypothetical protein